MLNALKRYEIQLLLSVGHTQAEVAKFAGVGERRCGGSAGGSGDAPGDVVEQGQPSRWAVRASVEPYRALVREIMREGARAAVGGDPAPGQGCAGTPAARARCTN